MGELELQTYRYRRSMELAAQAGAKSLAFPCISTGVHGYPAEPVARIAVDSVVEAASMWPSITSVIFCCFSTADLGVYRRILRQEAPNGEPE